MDLYKLAFVLGALICTGSATEVDSYTKIERAQIRSLQRKYYSVNNLTECAIKCDTETFFTCRSFTYSERDDQCWTSPENTKTGMIERGKTSTLYEKQEYSLECTYGTGKYYRGTQSKTGTGKTCQSWSARYPHTPNYTPEEYPMAYLESNFCRNPNGDRGGTWCYTTDPDTRWEHCNISRCTDECMHCTGEDYRGNISITEKRHMCQRWDSQLPHSHVFNPSMHPEMHLEQNFCRNPDGGRQPWCYTTDPSIRWEYCLIPRCKSEPPTIIPELTCATGNGEAYRGTIAVTESGKTCQYWFDQSEHTPQSYPCKGLDMNYCRNPNKKERPWCYTTDPETPWEYCDVPNCEDGDGTESPREEEDCYEEDGSSYRGITSETISGKRCQDWSSMTPHSHNYTQQNYPKGDLRRNLCRNPNGDRAPWCYTIDPSVRWEYCNMEQCPTNTSGGTPTSEPPTLETPSTAIPQPKDCKFGNGETYRGPTSVTSQGLTCQAWSAQSPHRHKSFTPETHPDEGLEGNSCRNPDDNVSGLWCYTTDINTRWDYCGIPDCEKLKCGMPVFKPKRCFDRIVGGCVSKPHSWPWQISLQGRTGEGHICGGSLIDPQWILTAAHCLENSDDPAYYKVVLGAHKVEENETLQQERDVEKLIRGPNEGDIALFKLKRPAQINDIVRQVCLPEKDYIVPNRAECYVTGWGKTKGTGGKGFLKEAGVPVIENKVCSQPSLMNRIIKDNEMCAGFIEGGNDSCRGDSGGPLVCVKQNRFILQGVVSEGVGCGTATRPGIYTRVSKFVDWINHAIKET